MTSPGLYSLSAADLEFDPRPAASYVIMPRQGSAVWDPSKVSNLKPWVSTKLENPLLQKFCLLTGFL